MIYYEAGTSSQKREQTCQTDDVSEKFCLYVVMEDNGPVDSAPVFVFCVCTPTTACLCRAPPAAHVAL